MFGCKCKLLTDKVPRDKSVATTTSSYMQLELAREKARKNDRRQWRTPSQATLLRGFELLDP